MKTLWLGALLMPAMLALASPPNSSELEKTEFITFGGEEYETFCVADLNQDARELIHDELGNEVITIRLIIENDQARGIGINENGDSLGELALSSQSENTRDFGCGPCGSAENPKKADIYHGNTLVMCSYRCPER